MDGQGGLRYWNVWPDCVGTQRATGWLDVPGLTVLGYAVLKGVRVSVGQEPEVTNWSVSRDRGPGGPSESNECAMSP